MLDGLSARDAEFHANCRRIASRAAYEISPGAPIAVAASNAIRRVRGSVEQAGMPFWTDTGLLAAVGIPGVVFGPRGEGMHGAEEYVELESVATCADVLRELIRSWCA